MNGKYRYIENLDQLFDVISWERKFEHQKPYAEEIVRVFRNKDIANAKQYFKRNKEVTARIIRSAFLSCDSLGTFLAVTEVKQEKE